MCVIYDDSVGFVIWSVDSLLCDNVVLWLQHVELRILERTVWVLKLGHSLLARLLSVSVLAEDGCFRGEFALEFSRLWVEPVVVSHSLFESGVLPHAERKGRDQGDALE